MLSAAKELLCCAVTKKHFSLSLFMPSTRSGQTGGPTHMQKHNDAHGVMQDDSGFADSPLTTGM